MPREIDDAMMTSFENGSGRPIRLVMLTFRSSTQYAWSGTGDIFFGGQTYHGQGSLGTISDILEGVDVKADGVTVTLMGINPLYLADCLTDIQHGAPAKIWLASLGLNGQIIGTPYLQFVGGVDKPNIKVGTGSTGVTISLALENKMVEHARATNRRYTSADQRLYFPTDSGFDFVEVLNDIALRWGS